MTAVPRNLSDATDRHGRLRMRWKGSLLMAAFTRCELALPTQTGYRDIRIRGREALIGPKAIR